MEAVMDVHVNVEEALEDQEVSDVVVDSEVAADQIQAVQEAVKEFKMARHMRVATAMEEIADEDVSAVHVAQQAIVRVISKVEKR
jgi:hypothetical protein